MIHDSLSGRLSTKHTDENVTRVRYFFEYGPETKWQCSIATRTCNTQTKKANGDANGFIHKGFVPSGKGSVCAKGDLLYKNVPSHTAALRVFGFLAMQNLTTLPWSLTAPTCVPWTSCWCWKFRPPQKSPFWRHWKDLTVARTDLNEVLIEAFQGAYQILENRWKQYLEDFLIFVAVTFWITSWIHPFTWDTYTPSNRFLTDLTSK